MASAANFSTNWPDVGRSFGLRCQHSVIISRNSWFYNLTKRSARDQKVSESWDSISNKSWTRDLLLEKDGVTWGHSGTSSWGRDPCMTNLSRRSSSLICVVENRKKLVTGEISTTGNWKLTYISKWNCSCCYFIQRHSKTVYICLWCPNGIMAKGFRCPPSQSSKL